MKRLSVRKMATLSCYLGIYAAGCVVAMIYFLIGRWPAVLEKSWCWPVIFLWPLLILWPLHFLVKQFRWTDTAHPSMKAQEDENPSIAIGKKPPSPQTAGAKSV